MTQGARAPLPCWTARRKCVAAALRSAVRALPKDPLAAPRQQLDALSERLPRALRANAQIHHTQFSRIAGRLAPQLLRTAVERRRERYHGLTRRLATSLIASTQAHRARIVRYRDRVTALGERSQRATLALLNQRAARVERAERLLAAFSYRGVLARGFALVRDGEGHPLRSAAAVSARMRLEIEFSDGRVGGDGGRRRRAAACAEAQIAAARRRRLRRAGQPVRGLGQNHTL